MSWFFPKYFNEKFFGGQIKFYWKTDIAIDQKVFESYYSTISETKSNTIIQAGSNFKKDEHIQAIKNALLVCLVNGVNYHLTNQRKGNITKMH